jgi:hypothetical protein
LTYFEGVWKRCVTYQGWLENVRVSTHETLGSIFRSGDTMQH